MSGASSSAGGWSTRLEPVSPPDDLPRRSDDPRLGEVVEFWQGGAVEFRPGRSVLIGFPQDEGVRRNGGRAGAAEAPAEIRRWLYRLTTWDGRYNIDFSERPPLDLGNVRIEGTLEETQQALGEVVAAVLTAGAIPVVLGGGHETAYGHYLGYVLAGLAVGIINIDAHLDVRPCPNGLGHNGSPFRQAMEHPTDPLPGKRYVCLGAQPHAVAREHHRYVRERGGRVRWCDRLHPSLLRRFLKQCRRLGKKRRPVYVTLDADVVQAGDVPGVSAPNAAGLRGEQVLSLALVAGMLPPVASFDLVEINPRLDRDGQSARWAALAVWQFLAGTSMRTSEQASRHGLNPSKP
jgi:formiminoglutamase